jgi:hypothetical protein
VAQLRLVRPVSATDDPRFSIWNALHDGEITIAEREAPEVLVLFVSIPYVRRRIPPLGDSFRLRLGGFRGMVFDDEIRFQMIKTVPVEAALALSGGRSACSR